MSPRWVFAAVILTLSAPLATLDYCKTPGGRWLWKRLNQYSGCRCEQCLDHYAWTGPPYRGGCTTRPRSAMTAATQWGVFAGATVGVCWLAGAVGSRKSVPGLCVRCGYDLAGLPSGAPCPECGRAPTDV